MCFDKESRAPRTEMESRAHREAQAPHAPRTEMEGLWQGIF